VWATPSSNNGNTFLPYDALTKGTLLLLNEYIPLSASTATSEVDPTDNNGLPGEYTKQSVRT
jgi:hypothetical protein